MKSLQRNAKSLSKDKGVWITNTGTFKTTKRATAENIGLPDFYNKRIIPKAIFSINKNPEQNYKAIFGLDFLCLNGIDFINRKKIIERGGVRIPLESCGGHKCKALVKKSISKNSYIPMTVREIVEHRNQETLREEQKR